MGKTAEGAENAEGELSGKIIGAAIRVLDELKPGLDEKLYENALVIELAKLGLQPEQQKSFPVQNFRYRKLQIKRVIFGTANEPEPLVL